MPYKYAQSTAGKQNRHYTFSVTGSSGFRNKGSGLRNGSFGLKIHQAICKNTFPYNKYILKGDAANPVDLTHPLL